MPRRNALIASIEPELWAQFQDRFTPFEFGGGRDLQRPGDDVDLVQFPTTAVICLGVETLAGESVKVALLGPEGVCRALFDDDVRRIKSAAVLRTAMWREGRPGLVAFGSSDFEGFTADMGAELVAFVARVVERVAERWPVLG